MRCPLAAVYVISVHFNLSSHSSQPSLLFSVSPVAINVSPDDRRLYHHLSMAPLNAVALLLALVLAAPTTSLAAVVEERSTFTACLSASKVTTVTSSSSSYNTDRLAFNRRLSYKPAAIVYPYVALRVLLLEKLTLC